MYILEIIEPDERYLIHATREEHGYRNKRAQSPEALETAMDALVSSREEWWIALARLLGWPILNTEHQPIEPILVSRSTRNAAWERIEYR
jgi:hypothetical protein